jgi:hypothetical protein
MEPEALVLLGQIAQSLISLCVSRKEEIGKPGYSGQDLGEILDVSVSLIFSE